MGQVYNILDNGGIRQIVTMKDGGKTAEVFFNAPPDGHPDKKLIKTFKGIKGVFEGEDESHWGVNTILLEMGNKQVQIGDQIQEFQPESPIQKLQSVVGNSAVPYPVAVDTADNVYFMLDKAMFVEKMILEKPDKIEDAQSEFQGFTRNDKKPLEKKAKKVKGQKQIHHSGIKDKPYQKWKAE